MAASALRLAASQANQGYGDGGAVGSFDGSSHIGSLVGRPYSRQGGHSYKDLPGVMRDDLPPAREVAQRVFSAQQAPPHPSVSALLYAWGQLVITDIAQTNKSKAEPIDLFPPCGNDTSSADRFYRSAFVTPNGVRHPVNLKSAWIDGSSLYGHTEEERSSIRDGKDGRVRLDKRGFPMDVGAENESCSIAFVEPLLNLHPLLSVMAIVMLREHNRYASLLASRHKEWSDDDVFAEAKTWVIALIQKITVKQYLPVLLGHPLPAYEGHDPSVDPSPDVFVVSSALRYGHFVIPSQVPLLDPTSLKPHPVGHLPIDSSIRQPCTLTQINVEPFLLGALFQSESLMHGAIVSGVRHSSRTEACVAPTKCIDFDLAATNVQRGRDWGVPLYNDVRRAYGLERVASVSELVGDGEMKEALEELYGSIDGVEAYVGANVEMLRHAQNGSLSGDHVAVLSPTHKTAVQETFQHIRHSDPRWFERYFPSLEAAVGNTLVPFRDPDLAKELVNITLADVLQRNTRVCRSIPSNPFLLSPATLFAPSSDSSADAGGVSRAAVPAYARCDDGSKGGDKMRRADDWLPPMSLCDGAVVVRWRFLSPQKEIEFELRGHSTGWVGLGLSSTGYMARSTLFIAHAEGDQAIVRAYQAGSDNKPRIDEDKTEIIRVIGGKIDGEWTTVNFVLPLSEVGNVGREEWLLAAVGPDGVKGVTEGRTEDAYHSSRRQAVRVDFAQGSVTAVLAAGDGRRVMYVHGVIMWGASTVFVPAGVCLSRYFKHTTWWLVTHERLGLMAASNMVGLAVTALAQRGALFTTAHSYFGIGLICIMVFLVGSGYLNRLWLKRAAKCVMKRQTGEWSRRLHTVLGIAVLLGGLANSVLGCHALFPEFPGVWQAQLTLTVAILAFMLVLELRKHFPEAFYQFSQALPRSLQVGILAPVPMHFVAPMPHTENSLPVRRSRTTKWLSHLIWGRRGGGKAGAPHAAERTFTCDDVCDAVLKGGQWVVLMDGVYDVRGFLPSHPGGGALVEKYIGCDITAQFLGLEDGREIGRETSMDPRESRPDTHVNTDGASQANFEAPPSSPSLNQQAHTRLCCPAPSGVARRKKPPQSSSRSPRDVEKGLSFVPKGMSFLPGRAASQLWEDSTLVGRPHSVFAGHTLRKYRVGTIILPGGPHDRKEKLELAFTPPPSYFAQRGRSLTAAQRMTLALLTNTNLYSHKTSESLNSTRATSRRDAQSRASAAGAGGGVGVALASPRGVEAKKQQKSFLNVFSMSMLRSVLESRRGDRNVLTTKADMVLFGEGEGTSKETEATGATGAAGAGVGGGVGGRQATVLPHPEVEKPKRVIAGLYQEMHVIENATLTRRADTARGLLSVHRLTLESLVPLAVHSYRPGMHVDLIGDLCGRRLRRSYSVAAPPSPHRLILILKCYPTDGRGMSEHLATATRPGDTVRVRGFIGSNLLRKALPLPSSVRDKTPFRSFWPYCAVIAGGTGMCAFLNLIRHQSECYRSLRRDPTIKAFGEMGIVLAVRDIDEAHALGWGEIRQIKQEMDRLTNVDESSSTSTSGRSSLTCIHTQVMLSRVGSTTSGDKSVGGAGVGVGVGVDDPSLPPTQAKSPNNQDTDVEVGTVDAAALRRTIPFLSALAQAQSQSQREDLPVESPSETAFYSVEEYPPTSPKSPVVRQGNPDRRMDAIPGTIISDERLNMGSEAFECDCPTIRSSRVLVCGPQSFRDAMRLCLREIGVPTECIKFPG
ncbi:unnamed protein product [Vitrella brassicaformis CCMP3155]|uniref:Cytochrome b5 heme-binding domain-containing protein n=3 Tax=Vitrella brassicaformis TaxID=1169539 RepID=A0A0G4EF05_VITBC|nr:unnamed protein product [Vitrella brassicaformis CCMP3155]|eukprot:CEL94099.1 unnamed protein product [Vitrella brassicaformis CCMP3155]